MEENRLRYNAESEEIKQSERNTRQIIVRRCHLFLFSFSLWILDR
jgi:hypothetical protein